jgi:mannosyltransferase OCH1-like enzyme
MYFVFIPFGLSWIVVILLLSNFSRGFAESHTYSPLFPDRLPEVSDHAKDPTYGKHIPRKLWIAVKDRNDPIPSHLNSLFQRNPQWEVTLCDNACKDEFMEKAFRDTAVLWAYRQIHHMVYAAKADIWRYAVLYTYGGVYLDDDSDINQSLDSVSSGL